MYEGGKGAGPVATGSGAILLPNTGGNAILTIVAITAMVIGGAIMASTIIRLVAKQAYKA